MLPKERHQQFLNENELIKTAGAHGLKVPKIYSINLCESTSVMVMQWLKGRNLYEELRNQPQSAEKLGAAFGREQAAIHSIRSSVLLENDWLSPKTKEESQLVHKIHAQFGPLTKVFLHLDYHPLNVLTDGQQSPAY
ncbi:aminoglycoside phosphotransferase (APT) family kinase protein [Peribacillus deserti]|uniref:Aminoglycoside phosphotransferase (APT) family kinase protein n=1 Tax=Peribacillus deserti TaxID=673318 RepID=A0ABS2QEM8_9BACI|nr:phosphotransferase [Peribacillus deserti]MBM7691159.1 aminoglycoside phosphotransferase (APT) family kinase protein [Peribacillus deserti]